MNIHNKISQNGNRYSLLNIPNNSKRLICFAASRGADSGDQFISSSFSRLKAENEAFSSSDDEELAEGRTTLHLEAGKNYPPNQVMTQKKKINEILRKYPDYLNARDFHGNTPLHYAALEGNTGIVRFLLSKTGIDRFAANNKGETPADFADSAGHANIARTIAEGQS